MKGNIAAAYMAPFLLRQIPDHLTERNYTLGVEGRGAGSYGYLFFNESELLYEQKYISVFMQTDLPHYLRHSPPGTVTRIKDTAHQVQ